MIFSCKGVKYFDGFEFICCVCGFFVIENVVVYVIEDYLFWVFGVEGEDFVLEFVWLCIIFEFCL